MAFRFHERSLRETEGGREREGGIENEEMTGRRETAWQTDSQQQPRHLTELSNTMIVCVCVYVCVCGCVRASVFFPLVYHDS